RFSGFGDTEAFGPGFGQQGGHGQHAQTVRIGLENGHHLGGFDRLRDAGEVAADRRAADFETDARRGSGGRNGSGHARNIRGPGGVTRGITAGSMGRLPGFPSSGDRAQPSPPTPFSKYERL